MLPWDKILWDFFKMANFHVTRTEDFFVNSWVILKYKLFWVNKNLNHKKRCSHSWEIVTLNWSFWVFSTQNTPKSAILDQSDHFHLLISWDWLHFFLWFKFLFTQNSLYFNIAQEFTRKSSVLVTWKFAISKKYHKILSQGSMSKPMTLVKCSEWRVYSE